MKPNDKTIVVGVDPGASGGICIMYPTTGLVLKEIPAEPKALTAIVTAIQKSLCCVYWPRCHCINGKPAVKVFIEQVHSMPGQGVSSTFKFGVNYGRLLQAFSMYEIINVRPVAWQKPLVPPRRKDETKGEHKDKLRLKAKSLYPDLTIWNGTLKIQRSLCDAILIAHYGKLEIKKGNNVHQI